MFEGIKDYRFDSVSPALVPSIIDGVKQEIKGVVSFLDSRMCTGDYISVS